MSRTPLMLIYQGFQTHPYFGCFHNPFVNPSVEIEVNFKAAVIGQAIPPMSPLPTPLKNPLVPCFFAPWIGFVTIPATP